MLERLILFWMSQMPHLTYEAAKELALKQIEDMKEEGAL
jgi:hypothetical protein